MNRVQIDADRAKHWLSVGAQPTDRVARFLDAAGVKERAARSNPKKGEPGEKAKERAEERQEPRLDARRRELRRGSGRGREARQKGGSRRRGGRRRDPACRGSHRRSPGRGSCRRGSSRRRGSARAPESCSPRSCSPRRAEATAVELIQAPAGLRGESETKPHERWGMRRRQTHRPGRHHRRARDHWRGAPQALQRRSESLYKIATTAAAAASRWTSVRPGSARARSRASPRSPTATPPRHCAAPSLTVPRAALPPLGEGEYYHIDLIGLALSSLPMA